MAAAFLLPCLRRIAANGRQGERIAAALRVNPRRRVASAASCAGLRRARRSRKVFLLVRGLTRPLIILLTRILWLAPLRARPDPATPLWKNLIGGLFAVCPPSVRRGGRGRRAPSAARLRFGSAARPPSLAGAPSPSAPRGVGWCLVFGFLGVLFFFFFSCFVFSFFVSLLLVFRLLIWSLRSYHRPPLLSRLSASPPFVAASPWSSSRSAPRRASRSLSVSPRLALALHLCCVAGSVARGGWLGVWPFAVLRPLASLSPLVVSLLAARSFRFFS